MFVTPSPAPVSGVVGRYAGDTRPPLVGWWVGMRVTLGPASVRGVVSRHAGVRHLTSLPLVGWWVRILVIPHKAPVSAMSGSLAGDTQPGPC